MSELDAIEIGSAERLALAYLRAPARERAETFFALDRRLARIVGRTSEPMLGQMRLAWWREMLQMPPAERPGGDAVLDRIGLHWAGDEGLLLKLVDGWELLLAAPPLGDDAIESFAGARAAPLAAIAGPQPDPAHERVRLASERWALADAASHVSHVQERDSFIAAGLRPAGQRTRIPRALRGIAVLEALALRALRAGGRPLLEGRGAALAALRAGLLGR